MDWGAVVSALIAIGGLIGIYIRMTVALKGMDMKQKEFEGGLKTVNKRIDALQTLIENQIKVDGEVKTELAVLSEQILQLVKRIDRNGV